MEKKQFRITIDASKEKIWSTLWNDDTYGKWTDAFAPGSKAETDWQQGSKVLFLDGNNNGMVSRIAVNRPNEYMSIEHLGSVTKGVENADSFKNTEWEGAHENYTLNPSGDQTELIVDMDISKEYLDYFMETWPKALRNVKTLSENK